MKNSRFSFLRIPRITFALFFSISIISWSCTNKNIHIDYCKLLEADQSHLGSKSASLEENKINRELRKALFKDNFNEIIEYSKINGFPEMGSLKSSGLDSCRNWAVMITLFHIGQSQPKLFFEKETKMLLEKEINNGRLKSGSLFPPLREGFRNHDFCVEQKKDILTAIKEWQINVEDLPDIKFVACSD